MTTAMQTDSVAPKGCAPLDGSQLLAQAGVQIGQVVFWQPAPTPIGQSGEMLVTIKGIHLGQHDINRGVPAIEVMDAAGHRYRAYPGEIRPANSD